MTYDFKAWLRVQPNDKPYDYQDCTGECAMGQWMTSIGEDWSLSRYNRHVYREFGEDITPLQHSKTFGELKAKVLEPA